MNKEVYKVTLGGVTVRLRNKVNVCEAFLDDIFSYSGLDGRELLLILDDKNGDGYGANGLRASATSSCVFDQDLFPSGNNAATNVTITQETVPRRGDMEIIDLIQLTEWDAVVCVPRITAEKWKDFKPYFAFVLGHELEHVKIIRENIKFHMYATWRPHYECNIFDEVGLNCKSRKTWNFPLELHCNRKGKKLAIKLFGEKEFRNCFNSLRASKIETYEHKSYLTFVRKKLKRGPYTENIWQSVCHDIRDYYYNKRLKTAAHEIWKNRKSNGDEIAEQFDVNEFLPLD